MLFTSEKWQSLKDYTISAVNCVDVDAVEYGDMVSLLDAVVAGREINIIWGVMEAGKGVSLYAVVGYGC